MSKRILIIQGHPDIPPGVISRRRLPTSLASSPSRPVHETLIGMVGKLEAQGASKPIARLRRLGAKGD